MGNLAYVGHVAAYHIRPVRILDSARTALPTMPPPDCAVRAKPVGFLFERARRLVMVSVLATGPSHLRSQSCAFG